MRAHADDRPFLRTTNALASEDADGWEVSGMLVANRHGQALSTQIEHDLSATQRLEVEFGGSANARSPEPERGLRLRSLWLSPEQASWGFATKLGFEPGRSGEGEGRRTQAQGVFSWSPTAGQWVHLNLGWQWRQSASRTAMNALAWQAEWTPTRWVYAEAAGTGDGRDRVLHMGLRHWLQAHRVALDTGLGRQTGSERPGQFVAINLSFFDWDF